MSPPSKGEVQNISKDAAQIASGGGIVFAAGLADRALRLLVTWLLSGALGSAIFGSYTFAITVASVITVFSPLGLDFGAVYFGAQYRKKQQQQKTKGLVIAGGILCAASGIICCLLLWILAPTLFDDPTPIQWIAPALLFWTPLFFVVGLLRSVKDMKGNALSQQLSLPAGLAIGALLVTALDLPLEAALIFFSLSLLLALLVGIWRARKHFKHLFQNTIQPEYETKKILRYSFPQGLAAMVFRLNVWMDILMMGYLTTPEQIGLYKIAASLAILGGLPINALTTIFNPFIAELVSTNELKRLNALLKTTTRWLISISFPVLLCLILLPDIALGIFDSQYQQSRTPLMILVGGQFVWVSCAIAMRLIPMSGHTTLNLINGIVAAVLNFGLNLWLIPKYGSIGAATATSITLAAWSLWRLIEIWWLLKCFPFSKTSFVLMVVAAAGGSGIYFMALEQMVHLVSVLAFVCIFFVSAFRFGGEKADEDIKIKIKSVAKRIVRRK